MMQRWTISALSHGFFALSLLVLLGLSGTAMADAAGDSKTVGTVVVYRGLLPAEVIRGHPAQHPESAMHGGRPAGSGEYHVVIALFDAKTGARIRNAMINARVSELGLSGEEKNLELMEIAGTETYGNYFRMVGKGPFRIAVTIRIPGEPGELKTEFEHRHR